MLIYLCMKTKSPKWIQGISKYIDRVAAGIERRIGKHAGTASAPTAPGATIAVGEIQRANRREPYIPADQLTGTSEEITMFRPRDKKPLLLFGGILTAAKILFVLIFAVAATGIGAVIGVANAYLETTPELNLNIITEGDLTSYIYDKNGEVLTTYAGLENREYATIEEIPLLLREAVISVEDVRFYEHNGVDFKGVFSAVMGNVLGNSTGGGSTITQQLIKNQMLTSERSYKRKIQEASLALELEKKYTKDQILEAYLNIIPLGGTNYGVKAAAKDYFGKELSELSLKEIACLAGITQYPYLYNPRRAVYVTKKVSPLEARIKLVLSRMYRAEYISLEQMNAALAEPLNVIERSTVQTLYPVPHFIEYAISDVINNLLVKRGLENTKANRSEIEKELRTRGYKIYTTVDRVLSEEVQRIISDFDKYPKLQNAIDERKLEKAPDGSFVSIPQPQAASVVIDQKTAEIRVMIGGRYEPTSAKTLNRASSAKMPVGSSIKPLAVYGPAFDLGYSPATIIDNIPIPIEGWRSEKGYPLTSTGTFGPTSIRRGIVSSLNNVAARTLIYKVGIETSAEYLLKLGVDPTHINKDGVGLALGSSGITPLEMAGAYSAIANGGTYLKPLSFTKVVDSRGAIVISADECRTPQRVYKESTAFMLVDVLQNAVKSGTGTAAKIEGMNVAGKTGTNTDSRGVYFAGMTPYYTATVWVGSDEYKKLGKAYNNKSAASGGNSAAPLWQLIMSACVDGLPNAPILPNSGATSKELVCGVSGMLATDACKADPLYKPLEDLFDNNSMPVEECDLHVITTLCLVSGMSVSEYCPESDRNEAGGGLVLPPDCDYFLLEPEELAKMFPNLIERDERICDVHTQDWHENAKPLENKIVEARALLLEAREILDSNNSITYEVRTNISLLISQLDNEIKNETATLNSLSGRIAALREAIVGL